MTVMSWLLDSDPSIRWQVMRDLGNESDEVVLAERDRIAREGWGAKLLALQTADGYWGGEKERRNWMTTVYSLLLLKELGIDAAAQESRRAIRLVLENITWWQLDGRPFFDGETEPCINGMIMAAGAHFGEASGQLVDRILEEQLSDGGWNCAAPTSKRASFNTTICVLEGLQEYEQARGQTPAVTSARLKGQEYLLERQMFKSRTSGQLIDRDWVRYSFPTTWHYDVLRGLDYLRSAGVRPDDRLAEAVDLVRKRRHQNGRWPLNVVHSDRLPFEMEAGVGKPSRWNTLRALRVLKWYES